MSNALTTQAPNVLQGAGVAQSYVAQWTREQVDVIKETVAKGATDAQLFMFLELAARYGLDPFAKEIWCVNMGGGMTIMASRDGYLKAAQRDPDFDGLKAFVVREGDEFSVDPVQDTVNHKFGAKRGAILGAWAIAYHKNRRPVIVWAEFNEYNKTTQVWKIYPSAMIQKVAEVMALKRQYGINGLVTQEEIGTPDERPYNSGPTIDHETGEVQGLQPVSEKQLQEIALQCRRIFGETEADEARARLFIGEKLGRTIESRKDLTQEEAAWLLKNFRATPNGKLKDWQPTPQEPHQAPPEESTAERTDAELAPDADEIPF